MSQIDETQDEPFKAVYARLLDKRSNLWRGNRHAKHARLRATDAFVGGTEADRQQALAKRQKKATAKRLGAAPIEEPLPVAEILPEPEASPVEILPAEPGAAEQPEQVEPTPPKRGRGRPKGSKNKRPRRKRGEKQEVAG